MEHYLREIERDLKPMTAGEKVVFRKIHDLRTELEQKLDFTDKVVDVFGKLLTSTDRKLQEDYVYFLSSKVAKVASAAGLDPKKHTGTMLWNWYDTKKDICDLPFFFDSTVREKIISNYTEKLLCLEQERIACLTPVPEPTLEETPEHLFTEQEDASRLESVESKPRQRKPRQPKPLVDTIHGKECVYDNDFIDQFNDLNRVSLLMNEKDFCKGHNLEKPYKPVKDELTGETMFTADDELIESSVKIMKDLKQLTLPDDVIEYQYPDYFDYLDNQDKMRELRKMDIVNARRQKLGLPPMPEPELKQPTEHERKCLDPVALEQQQELIQVSAKKKIGLNVFSWPIIHRFVDGRLFCCINFLDRYVNVSKLLKFAHDAGYTTTKNPKDVNQWLDTRKAKLLLNAGLDRYREGVPNPVNGKIYKLGIRMGYRVTKRLIYDECFDDDAHKGVYLHPRIAEHVALWVSPQFRILFANEFEDAIADYYELDCVEEVDPLYDTPDLPTSTQILFYRRYGPKSPNYNNGEVKISIGKSHYLNKLERHPDVFTIYKIRSVNDPKKFLENLNNNLPFSHIKANLYTFGFEESLRELVKVLETMDRYPSYIQDVWQDRLIQLERLGNVAQEQDMYEREKRAEFREKYYGKMPKQQRKNGYWLDQKTYIQITVDGRELPWKMTKPDYAEIGKDAKDPFEGMGILV